MLLVTSLSGSVTSFIALILSMEFFELLMFMHDHASVELSNSYHVKNNQIMKKFTDKKINRHQEHEMQKTR
jgi:hypothetical protein